MVFLIFANAANVPSAPLTLSLTTAQREKIGRSLRFCAPCPGTCLFMFFSRNSQPSSSSPLASKAFEELMNIDVTSVLRKDQKLSKAPAAVCVITQEAIERSGVTIIPDLLRMAPGVQVAQVEADRWAISVRGFNGGDTLAQWTHRYSSTWDSSLQVYGTKYVRHDTGIQEKLNVVDFDCQNHVVIGSKNDIVWGAGYRNPADQVGTASDGMGWLPCVGCSVALRPPAKNYNLFSVFLQDEVHLTEGLSLSPRHLEFGDVEQAIATELDRQAFGKIVWTF